jgi:microcystin-dependent protein
MQYLSELRIFSFPFAPRGWVVCDGRLLPVAKNTALFQLLGTTYGGDGVVNFGIPDLRMRVPMHAGDTITLGQLGGEVAHSLLTAEMPSHTHDALASKTNPNVGSPSNAFWCQNTGVAPYGPPDKAFMATAAVIPAGSGIPHENMSPYLVLNICMAITGIFPTRG